MTTLPQTTTARLPRTAGNGAVATVGSAASIIQSNSAAAAAATMTGADVWRVIRANAWLIILLLIVSGAIGYGCNWYLLHNYPKFTAEGILEVKPVSHPDPTRLEDQGVDPSMIALEVKTQVAKLKEGDIFTKLLQNESSEIRQTDWYKRVVRNNLDPREEFNDSFTVVALPETRYLKAEFTSPNPKDCQIIVREMCEEHIKEERANVLENGRELSLRLEQLKSYYQGQVNDADARLEGLRSSIASDGGEISGHISIREFQLERATEALVKAEADFHQVDTMWTTVQDGLKKGIDPPAIQQIVDSNSLLQQQKLTAKGLKSQYLNLVETHGDTYPQTAQLKRSWQREQTEADNMEAEARTNARISYMSNLQSNLAEVTKQRDVLKAQVDDASREIADSSAKLARYFVLEKQREVNKLELDRITHQGELLTNAQQQKLEDKVTWASQPAVPTTPSFPKLRIIMPIALGIGLLLALGIAFLREMTDTTIRSDRDIVRVGQMQLLGMVGDESQDPQASGARLPLVIFDAPHSITAEQLRQVRTRLQHVASLDTTRSLLVTSPGPGDGKTTIAANLAAGLALNGRRILLVDGNFRRPEIHKVFGIANEQGFSNVLTGALTFEEAVHETQVPNLAVMSSGPKPVNATEMFESQLLVDFIERAQEQYDHVIFDSAPMMVVSESAAMAPREDGVVTVCRARGNSRGLLTRMRDTLRALKAEHLGVVLNGVRAQGGGYYGRNIKTFYEYQNQA